MCIQYYIEFWLPVSNTHPSWERGVTQGLAPPGQNPKARVIHFFECHGQFLRRPKCSQHDIREGGCYNGRILDFCYEDRHCYMRMAEVKSAYMAARMDAEGIDDGLEHPTIVDEATRQLDRAYHDWLSVYEHHSACPGRREWSHLFRHLKRFGVVRDHTRIGDARRMGPHPRNEHDPSIVMSRHYDASPRRRW